MFGREYQFWMNGLLATRFKELSSDPRCLDDGNFWAVLTTFEGDFHFARFAKVERREFKAHEPWKRLERPWVTSMSQLDYLAYVHAIKEEIAQGGVYQVNACRQVSHYLGDKAQSLQGLFEDISRRNPAPFASYMKIPGFEIASASPERFLHRTGRAILTSPIKGTIRSHEDTFGEKDQAENLMIVDLMRNDLGQICEPGSVEVAELFRHEKHPGITHLVSDVAGTLRSEVGWEEILKALLPPGSVSGAPKSSALDIIAKFEKQGRGPYCGAIGYAHGDNAELAVGIRTFWTIGDGYLRYGTGAGITWGSDANHEWEETQLKARHLISIAGGIFE